MLGKLKRREFLKTGATMGAAFALGPAALFADPVPTVGIASGPDSGKAAAKAVELLGGMEGFVAKGTRVAILANVQSRHPGTFTGPAVLRSAIRLCKAAGASSIACLSLQPVKQWEDTGLGKILTEEGVELKLFSPKDEALFKTVPVTDGRALQEARILAELDRYDGLVNMPIVKDHAGNKFTGTMKNIMGLNASVSNRTFHKPNWQTDPNDIAHLDQCIVDLNKVVKPVLNIVDATEFITTNGPFGPGELARPGKVVAGTDRVAVDTICARILGVAPEGIIQIRRGAEQGLGQGDPRKIRIREARV
jgi:uncharacterized protein (DUF362 family)